MKSLKLVFLVVAIVVVAGIGFVYGGVFNVAADEAHWRVTVRLIEAVRERSIATRARDVGTPPALGQSQLVAAGAREYAEMCTGCHLAPGMKESEVRAGLYPQPPNFAQHESHRSPEQTFWIIKHGLKMTGMPAWGATHDDQRIWAMVAFLRQLPELSPDAYRELVEQGGGGHSHSDAGDSHDAAPAAEGHDTDHHEHNGA